MYFFLTFKRISLPTISREINFVTDLKDPYLRLAFKKQRSLLVSSIKYPRCISDKWVKKIYLLILPENFLWRYTVWILAFGVLNTKNQYLWCLSGMYGLFMLQKVANNLSDHLQVVADLYFSCPVQTISHNIKIHEILLQLLEHYTEGYQSYQQRSWYLDNWPIWYLKVIRYNLVYPCSEWVNWQRSERRHRMNVRFVPICFKSWWLKRFWHSTSDNLQSRGRQTFDCWPHYWVWLFPNINCQLLQHNKIMIAMNHCVYRNIRVRIVQKEPRKLAFIDVNHNYFSFSSY